MDAFGWFWSPIQRMVKERQRKFLQTFILKKTMSRPMWWVYWYNISWNWQYNGLSYLIIVFLCLALNRVYSAFVSILFMFLTLLPLLVMKAVSVAETTDRTAYGALILHHHLDNKTIQCSWQHNKMVARNQKNSKFGGGVFDWGDRVGVWSWKS